MLHKDPKNHNCEDRKAKSYAGQCCPQWIFISQEGYSLWEAVIPPTVWILVIWAFCTIIRIWGEKEQRLIA